MMQKLSIETLNEERLKKSVNQNIYEQGQKIFHAGRVQVVEVKDDIAQCIVQDRHPYRVSLKVAKNYLYLKCDCRYAFQGSVCEHDIAACLAIREVIQQRLPPTWRNQINKIVDSAETVQRKKTNSRYLLFFSLQEGYTYGYPSWKIIPFQLPNSVLAKFQDGFPKELDEAEIFNWFQTRPQISANLRTPYQLLKPEGCLNLPPESVLLANIILERARGAQYYINNNPLDEYLTLIADSPTPLYLGAPGDPPIVRLTVISQPGDLSIRMNRHRLGFQIQAQISIPERSCVLNIDRDTKFTILPGTQNWIRFNEALLKIQDNYQLELIQSFIETPEVIIPEKDETLFRNRYFLPLAEKFILDGDLIDHSYVETDPLNRIYLSEGESSIQAELRFKYGEYEVSYDAHYPEETIQQQPDTWTLRHIRRQPDKEQAAMGDLSSSEYGLKRTPNSPKPGLLSLRARIHPVDFLLNSVPRLIANNYEVFGEEQLTTARINRNQPTIAFQVSSGIDWFDVKTIVNYGDLEVSLKDLRRALRKKEHFIKLSDGSLGAIPNEWVEHYHHLFSLGNETEGGIRLSRHHISLLEQALEHSENVEIDSVYSVYRQRLHDFSGIKQHELPDNFTGELRPYQKAGFDWLHFLHQFDFGGCLADDMGLGKTVQVLVFLQSLKGHQAKMILQDPGQPPHPEIQECKGTNLIVVPKSLVVNWQREAARFTPNLQVLEYFNSNRSKDLSIFDDYDLVITTYGVMLRDITALRKYPFHYTILDESQVIKNPLSQTARAARLLKGCHRLVITGTPVENSSLELWSQFDFLNPGLLGNLEYFKTEFIMPIEKKGDTKTAQSLRRLVYPFILRRTKDQVAPELPPRTERILYCDMEPAQRKLYNRTRDYYRGMILGMLDNGNINTARFRILEGLLRLRQVCNHPRLIDDKFRGESAKFSLLLETIDTLRAENHKALIFSQFVQMLRILRQPMDDNHIPYLYLDGHTRNRMELVDTYQADPAIPFFLISLKAGGQGLNLTAADYVIHIDPWWNPAVEIQASDRTHRIGQEKPVFIYKLITRDSVEEKILLLQDRKRQLVDQLITTERSFFKSLTQEDVKLLFS